jgi:hypothetical protein
MQVTRRPQDLRTTPTLLAVTPLPRPLTTPPVISTYLVASRPSSVAVAAAAMVGDKGRAREVGLGWTEYIPGEWERRRREDAALVANWQLVLVLLLLLLLCFLCGWLCSALLAKPTYSIFGLCRKILCVISIETSLYNTYRAMGSPAHQPGPPARIV